MTDEFREDEEARIFQAEPDEAESRAELLVRLANAGLLRRRRVLVGVDSSLESLAALGAAAPLAASLGLDLEGLFVEDSDLIRSAQLPFTSEVRYGLNVLAPLEEQDLLRKLQQRANLARASFQEVTENRRVRGTFRVATGWPVRLLLEAGEEAGLIVLGRSGHRLHQRQLGTTAATVLNRSRSAVLLASAEVDDAADVVAILHEPSIREVMVDLVYAIAGPSRSVRLVVVGDSPEMVTEELDEHAGKPTFAVGETRVASPSEGPASLLRDYLLTKRASLVVIYDDGGVQSADLLRQLRTVNSWHLLVLRGSLLN